MRIQAVLVLTLVVGLAGCLESGDAAPRSSTVQCTNGDCVVCVDGECADCRDDECEACRTGDCPAFDRARATAPATPGDFSAQETHDLTFGLEETTWTFEVAAGATGHLSLVIRDLATGQAAVSADYCMRYTWENGRGSSTDGRRGNCSSGNLVVGLSGTTMDQPLVVLAWSTLDPGRYTVRMSAEPQVNELVVDIEVDNP